MLKNTIYVKNLKKKHHVVKKWKKLKLHGRRGVWRFGDQRRTRDHGAPRLADGKPDLIHAGHWAKRATRGYGGKGGLVVDNYGGDV